jgi:hypothetical protein
VEGGAVVGAPRRAVVAGPAAVVAAAEAGPVVEDGDETADAPPGSVVAGGHATSKAQSAAASSRAGRDLPTAPMPSSLPNSLDLQRRGLQDNVMAFGHWMEINEGDVRLRLGPLRREEAKRFVAAEAGFGMQSYEVTRYLGGGRAPTEQGEEEWWDTNSKDEGKWMWGVFVPEPAEEGADEETWTLIGNTAVFLRGDRRKAQSGFQLIVRAHWR